MPSENVNQGSNLNNYNQVELPVTNENSNTLSNCSKKAGSIRSNMKPLTESSFRENVSSSKTHLLN